MYNWRKCAVDVWFPVRGLVFVWLMCCWILATRRPRIAACTRHRMQCEECLYFTDITCGGVTVTSTNSAPSKTPVKQSSRCESQSTAPVQSYTGGNCCRGSDSFSALGTLLLDNRVANAHNQWDFPFQARRWKMLNYAVSAFNSNVVLWSFISTGNILGEISTTPQSFHGKENRLCCLEAIIW